MSFIFRGRLCAYTCRNCSEFLYPAIIRLYRVRKDQDVVALATADPRNTLRILDDKDVEAKQNDLIAETQTDEEGRFRFEIGDDADYDGEAFEFDVRLETVPGLEDPDREPIQATITTLSPQWRQRENDLVWVWEYCIPSRFWCRLRELFGAWVICGRVLVCGDQNESDQPIPNVRVFAIDRDWLQDDPLGSAVTDSFGRFFIYYTAADFRPGTFIDVELFGGPDVYFRVETMSGTPLLVEDPSRGRDSDRENVGSCFCVRLCLEELPPQPEPYPFFTSVGVYEYATEIDTGGSGLTTSSGRAFFNTIRLNGILSKTFGGQPMEYLFEVRDLDAPGGGTWTEVVPGQVARTEIGKLERWAPVGPGDPNPIKTRPYTVNGNAGELLATFNGNWIEVPQESNVFGPDGFFQPNGDMIRLVTETLGPTTGDADMNGLITGQSVATHLTSTGQPVPENRHYAIRMRVRQQGSSGAGTVAGVCQRIAINNHLYDNVHSHPAWAGSPKSDQLAVVMVDVAQLQTEGCAGITNALDVLVTASHPTLGSVSVSITGPGGPYAFTAPPPSANPWDRFGTATPPSGFSVAALDPCAYIITLSVQVLLTTGDSNPNDLIDQIAFCKS